MHKRVGYEAIADIQKGVGYEAAPIASTSDVIAVSVPRPFTATAVNVASAGNRVVVLGPEVVEDKSKTVLGDMEAIVDSREGEDCEDTVAVTNALVSLP